MYDTIEIAEMVVRAAHDRPDALAIYSPDGQKISFERLDRAVRGIAHNLDRNGIVAGSTVQFIVDNPVVQICGWIAAMRLGARPLILSSLLAEGSGLDIDLVVALPDQKVTGVRRTDLDQGWLEPPDLDPPMRGGQGYFCASSGSTGTMKLIERSQDDWAQTLRMSTKYLGHPDRPFLVGFNSSSSAAISAVGRAFAHGQGIVLPTTSAAETLRRAFQAGIGYANAPPPMLEDFCEAIEAGAVERPTGMRRIHAIGGSISPELQQRVERCFGVQMFNAYGSVEVCLAAVGIPLRDARQEPGLVGPLVSEVAIAIRDDDGADLPIGTEGRIFLRPDFGLTVRSYVTRPVPVDENGWFATGDVGRIRDDGQLVLTGRTAEMINVGGANRAPAYFEAVILAQPGVAKAAAFGMPGAGGYDRLAYAVVPGQGFDQQAVHLALTTHFSGLREISLYVMPSLPLGRTGKIDRLALRAQASGKGMPARQ